MFNFKSMFNFIQSIFHVVIISATVILSTFNAPFHTSKPAVLHITTTRQVTPTSSLTPTRPFPTSTPEVTKRVGQENAIQPTNIPIPTAMPLSSTEPQQQNTIDPNIKIELCKTQADKAKAHYLDLAQQEIQRDQPGIYALANTANAGETEAVALQYGYMKQSDVVRSADVFQKLISEGVSLDNAQVAAQTAGDTYHTYLRSLHDWGVNQLNAFNNRINPMAESYKDNAYQKCLVSQ